MVHSQPVELAKQNSHENNKTPIANVEISDKKYPEWGINILNDLTTYIMLINPGKLNRWGWL